MSHRKTTNWTMIYNMYGQCFADKMAEEVEV
jgi:hypothetical protein